MLMFFTFICFVIACYEWHMITKNKPYKTYGFIFLIISFYTFYDLSVDAVGFLFVLIVCVSTDIGGYVFGKIFNGPKLTKISPNKTYAGLLENVLSHNMLIIIMYIDYSYCIQFFITFILISTVVRSVI